MDWLWRDRFCLWFQCWLYSFVCRSILWKGWLHQALRGKMVYEASGLPLKSEWVCSCLDASFPFFRGISFYENSPLNNQPLRSRKAGVWLLLFGRVFRLLWLDLGNLPYCPLVELFWGYLLIVVFIVVVIGRRWFVGWPEQAWIGLPAGGSGF